MPKANAISHAPAPVTAIKNRPDVDLIQACLQDDQFAWRELVTRYNRLVFSIPRAYGLAEADCEDVFQNVFAAAVRQLPKLRDQQSLAKWLITTAHRMSWRSLDGRPKAQLDDDLVAEDVPPAELAARWERQQMVRQALRRLGGRCERLIAALYLDESRPTYDQIARQLSIPRGSIGPTRVRCLSKLLELLRPGGGE